MIVRNITRRAWKDTANVVIFILFALSVNGQIITALDKSGNIIEFPMDSISSKNVNYPISWQDTIKVKLLIYSECHNGAICLNGYVIRWFEDLGYTSGNIESFYNHKWQPIDKTKIFNWIKYDWNKRKRK